MRNSNTLLSFAIFALLVISASATPNQPVAPFRRELSEIRTILHSKLDVGHKGGMKLKQAQTELSFIYSLCPTSSQARRASVQRSSAHCREWMIVNTGQTLVNAMAQETLARHRQYKIDDLNFEMNLASGVTAVVERMTNALRHLKSPGEMNMQPADIVEVAFVHVRAFMTQCINTMDREKSCSHSMKPKHASARCTLWIDLKHDGLEAVTREIFQADTVGNMAHQEDLRYRQMRIARYLKEMQTEAHSQINQCGAGSERSNFDKRGCVIAAVTQQCQQMQEVLLQVMRDTEIMPLLPQFPESSLMAIIAEVEKAVKTIPENATNALAIAQLKKAVVQAERILKEWTNRVFHIFDKLRACKSCGNVEMTDEHRTVEHLRFLIRHFADFNFPNENEFEFEKVVNLMSARLDVIQDVFAEEFPREKSATGLLLQMMDCYVVN